MNKDRKYIGFALLAAVLYALSTPFSKLLLSEVSSTVMAGLLYLGAGAGLLIVALAQRLTGRKSEEEPLTRSEFPYTLAMILLDIAAPICLLYGLSMTTAANAALLNNFEIAATALIALSIFGEAISKRLWLAIALVSAASMLLSFEDMSSLSFSAGSLFVLLACVCWGIENNCTRKLSSKNPLEIVVVKGLCSGTGSLIIGFALGQRLPAVPYILAAMAVGFVAYGLSIFFYVKAQRRLGAAKTSAYYAAAPFVGTALSLAIFREAPGAMFWAALGVMALGVWFASTDSPQIEPKLRAARQTF